MRIFIATDYPVIHDDGNYYVEDKLNTILRRYYTAFGPITLCTRIVSIPVPSKYIDVSDCIEDVVSVSLPTSLLWLDNKKMSMAIKKCDLVIGRFDSIVSCRAAGIARRMKKPFYAELMADAWDGYWNHGIVGKILAPYMYFANRRAVKDADYALYVTRVFLQKRYPCKGLTTNASNVYLEEPSDKVLEDRLERIKRTELKNIVLATTANVDINAKGQQYVIRALPMLNNRGIHATYYLIGGGDQARLKSLAEELGVSEQVVFLGALSLKEVMGKLDDIDVYIQPSLQEGLPRATIEAMSRACPCLGSTTAGIPELLAPDCIFKRKSVDQIVEKLIGILDKKTLSDNAMINFARSKEYTDSVLSERRKHFFNTVIEDLNKKNESNRKVCRFVQSKG